MDQMPEWFNEIKDRINFDHPMEFERNILLWIKNGSQEKENAEDKSHDKIDISVKDIHHT